MGCCSYSMDIQSYKKINNTMTYNELMDKLYEYYSDLYQKDKTVGLQLPLKLKDHTYVKPPLNLFEDLIQDDLFCQKISINFYSRELSYQERYNLWFRNNFETGMEYNDSSIVDFDNSYYEYTPKELIVVQFNNKNYSCYK